jgi:hypothetical protein
MKKPNGYWNFEKCKEEALKYNTRSHFKNNSESAYVAAWQHKWLDEICNHMLSYGNKYKRCLYAFEFNDNHVYVGLTYNINGRYYDHLRDTNSTVYKYINEVNDNYDFKQIYDYSDVNIVKKMEEIKIQEYKNNGWIILNKVKGGNIGSNSLIWNYDKCKDVSSEYNNLKKFRKDYQGAYLSITRNHWNDLLYHMKNRKEWSPKDEQFLFNNYHMGSKYCSKQLNRSIDSIHNRAIILGIKKFNENCPIPKNFDTKKISSKWKIEDINFLRENYYKYGADYCSKKLNKTKSSIYIKVSRFNLNK